MKERRKNGPKRPAHAELQTRRPKAAPAAKAPKRAQPDLELLQALRAWVAGRAGEDATDDALSAAARPDRFRLKGSLDRVYRHYARLSWLIERQGLPRNADMLWGAASVILWGVDPDAAARAAAVTTADIRTLASAFGRMSGEGLDHADMPEWAALECPQRFYPIFQEAFGPRLKQELVALGMSAPLDIRANTLKTTRDDLIATLAAANADMRPTTFAPHGLRAAARPDLAATAAFTSGAFDMQDEGSQMVAAIVDARPGQWVLDFAAGAGGKSLALAAAMNNRGHLVASDTHAKRLTRAKLRFKRAGVENAERIQLTGTDDDPFIKKRATQFDRVLVDAPCSGTGAWRRHPEAKWKSEADIPRLTALQDAILKRAARMVKRGGRLVYATCSLLREENERRAEAFLAAHPGFKLVPAETVWAEAVSTPWPGGDSTYLQLTPALHGTDGFFAAVFQRTA